MRKLALCFLFLSVTLLGCSRKEVQVIEGTEKDVLSRIDGNLRDISGRIPSREEITKDYYFIFFGADWCPFCKKRQPLLLTFYNEYKEREGDFEIILAGALKDKSNEDILRYMKKENFSFFYLDYDSREEAGFFSLPEFVECEKFYIPSLILMDKTGKVLSCSNGPKKEDYYFMRPIEEYLRTKN